MSADEETYTHGHHESVLRSHTARTVENSAAYVVADLTPSTSVLDVGCGPGTITIDIARRVAPGRVVGLDNSADVVRIAQEYAEAQGDGTTEFVAGDVYALDFPDDTFDVVHAHQVLQHLVDPVAALTEMQRVCRPGGVVAARDADYAAMTWFPQSDRLDRWLEIYRTVAKGNRAEPDAARHLLGWARAAGFGEITSTASAWCYASPQARQWWGGMWADRIVASDIARQAVEQGLATSRELAGIATAWRAWIDAPDGWFGIIHGEIRCRA